MPFVRTVRLAVCMLGLALQVHAETPLTGTTSPAAETLAPASAMSPGDRADLRAEVRAYLLENPEVLMEAIAVLEKRRDDKAASDDVALLRDNADAIYNDPASWVGGNPQGDITVVEFMDYRCGYCRKAHDEVAALVKSDGNIRFVVKEFPILGPQSDVASRFAIAVLQIEGDTVYGKVHEALMTMAGDLDAAAMAKIASASGVSDMAAVTARMDSPEVQSVIDANHALGQTLAINGTPTFVVQGTMLRGYVPLDGMRQVVAEARKG